MDPRIESLIKLIGAALEATKESQKVRDQFQSTAAKAKNVDEFTKAIKTFIDAAATPARTELASLEEANKLAQDLGKSESPAPGSVSPDAIVTQFRTLINNAQRDARVAGNLESAATIKSLDVELKGLIVVDKNQAAIVPPHPDKPIDAGQLSTIRMSFGAIPLLKVPTEEPK